MPWPPHAAQPRATSAAPSPWAAQAQQTLSTWALVATSPGIDAPMGSHGGQTLGARTLWLELRGRDGRIFSRTQGTYALVAHIKSNMVYFKCFMYELIHT